MQSAILTSSGSLFEISIDLFLLFVFVVVIVYPFKLFRNKRGAQKSVEFCSVQDGIGHTGKAICAPPRLSSVGPVLPFKQSHCWSDWRRPRKMVERFLFLRLFFPGYRWLRDVLGFVPAGGVSSFSTLHIIRDASHFGWLLCPPVCLLSYFAWFRHVQNKGVFEGQCWILSQANIDFQFHFSLFLDKITESVRMMACVVCHLSRQSSREHVWQLPFPLWSWRLKPNRLHCLVNGGCTPLNTEALPPLVFGDREFSVHYEIP